MQSHRGALPARAGAGARANGGGAPEGAKNQRTSTGRQMMHVAHSGVCTRRDGSNLKSKIKERNLQNQAAECRQQPAHASSSQALLPPPSKHLVHARPLSLSPCTRKGGHPRLHQPSAGGAGVRAHETGLVRACKTAASRQCPLPAGAPLHSASRSPPSSPFAGHGASLVAGF